MSVQQAELLVVFSSGLETEMLCANTAYVTDRQT